jgi:hypothetical protein
MSKEGCFSEDRSRFYASEIILALEVSKMTSPPPASTSTCQSTSYHVRTHGICLWAQCALSCDCVPLSQAYLCSCCLNYRAHLGFRSPQEAWLENLARMRVQAELFMVVYICACFVHILSYKHKNPSFGCADGCSAHSVGASARL